MRNRSIHNSPNLRCVGDVSRKDESILANLVSRFVEASFAPPDECDLGALTRECDSAGASDARSSAGYKSNFILQSCAQ